MVIKKIFFLIFILSIFLSCSKNKDELKDVIPQDKIEEKHNIFYEKGKSAPFNGKTLKTYPMGEKEIIFEYQDGKKIKETQWYKNGSKKKDFFYKNGNGESTEWYENEQKKKYIKWKNGKKIEDNWWNQDGEKIK